MSSVREGGQGLKSCFSVRRTDHARAGQTDGRLSLMSGRTVGAASGRSSSSARKIHDSAAGAADCLRSGAMLHVPSGNSLDQTTHGHPDPNRTRPHRGWPQSSCLMPFWTGCRIDWLQDLERSSSHWFCPFPGAGAMEGSSGWPTRRTWCRTVPTPSWLGCVDLLPAEVTVADRWRVRLVPNAMEILWWLPNRNSVRWMP